MSPHVVATAAAAAEVEAAAAVAAAEVEAAETAEVEALDVMVTSPLGVLLSTSGNFCQRLSGRLETNNEN